MTSNDIQLPSLYYPFFWPILTLDPLAHSIFKALLTVEIKQLLQITAIIA